MSKSRRHVGKGDEFLCAVSRQNIKKAFKHERSGKSRERLRAALLRKEGHGMKDIADQLGRSTATVFEWLYRLDQEGLDARHDRKSPGRPPKLSYEEQSELREMVSEPPTLSGYASTVWTSRVLADVTQKLFARKYTRAGVLVLARRLQFTVRGLRPVPYDTPSREVVEEYKQKTVEKLVPYLRRGFRLLCLDSVGFANSPRSARGLRLKESRDVVGINYSTKTQKAIGALGDGVLHLRFQDKADSTNAIAMLEEMRQKYGKIIVILDNALAHKSKQMREYLAGVNDDVILHFLPPHCPQHNPIEIQWREIKRAITCGFFEGGFEEMKAAIRRLLDQKEVVTVKLLDYMLDAIATAATAAA